LGKFGDGNSVSASFPSFLVAQGKCWQLPRAEIISVILRNFCSRVLPMMFCLYYRDMGLSPKQLVCANYESSVYLQILTMY